MRRQSQKVAVAIQDGKDSLEIFERILTSSSLISFFVVVCLFVLIVVYLFVPF